MRVESSKPCDNGGWLHSLNSDAKPFVPKAKLFEPPKINVTKLLTTFQSQTMAAWIEKLATDLGVSFDSLRSLDVAWASPFLAWAFPMRDGFGDPIGIRLRTSDGKKFAVTGSRQGLFISEYKPQPDLYICEGPTDTAAMLSIGLYAIGRPSCLGCEDMIRDFIRVNKIRTVTIVADADEPGQRGAEKLQTSLKVKSKIWTPQEKDIREAVKKGITSKLVEQLAKHIFWTQPKLMKFHENNPCNKPSDGYSYQSEMSKLQNRNQPSFHAWID
jgi:5S rRNA maturation endonuclease (ribonuclease M5)